MKTLIPFSAVIILSLFGCSSIPNIEKHSPAVRHFQQQIDSILSQPIFDATIAAVKIISLDNNEVLYERNSNALLRPASNMKLFTTSTALITLGKNFSIPTRILYDGNIQDSILNGNLFVKGFGDPDFSSAVLSQMVSEVKAKGITKINGSLIGDASYFDEKRWGTGWMWDDEPYDFSAYNSALSINRNCIAVYALPGNNIGDTVQAWTVPATQFVTIENSAITDTSSSAIISRKFDERLNVITINGTIQQHADTLHEAITIRSPENYFLTLLKEDLARQGINCSGTIKMDTVPASAVLISEHLQPIDSMMIYLNKESDNLSAENLLKIIGAEKVSLPGSTENGISAVKQVLNSFGIDSTSFLQVDGSGVSFYNLIRAEHFIKILQAMYQQKNLFDLFYSTLPVAGIDGTLSSRMKNSPAENNLHAKTGTISGVTSLSGYVKTPENEMLAFSIIMQNFIGTNKPYREAQDAIGILMASFKRK